MLGVDVVSKARIGAVWQRQGERFPRRVLHPRELEFWPPPGRPERFLAVRWAVKEALSKALGTGLRGPVRLNAIALEHDELGAPRLHCDAELAPLLAGRRPRVSISDERDLVVAVVLLL